MCSKRSSTEPAVTAGKGFGRRGARLLALVFAVAGLVAACSTAGSSNVAAPLCRTSDEGRRDVDAAVKASAGCLVLHEGKLLVVRDRRSGRLGFPAGGAAAGEAAPCTAHRETWEETGVSVVVGARLLVADNGFHLYRCFVEEGDVTAEPSGEIPEQARSEITFVGWLRPDSIQAEDWRFPQQWPWVQQWCANEASADGVNP